MPWNDVQNCRDKVDDPVFRCYIFGLDDVTDLDDLDAWFAGIVAELTRFRERQAAVIRARALLSEQTVFEKEYEG